MDLKNEVLGSDSTGMAEVSFDEGSCSRGI